MTDKPSQPGRIDYLLLLGLTLFLIWFSLPMIPVASGDMREVSSFSQDESHHLYLIQEALKDGSFKIYFQGYGHFYFNITLIILYALKPFLEITPSVIMITMRSLSLLFSICSVWSLYFFSARFFPLFVSRCSAVILSLFPYEYLGISAWAHPDTLQLFLLILTIWSLAEFLVRERMKFFFIASICAGLGFATKYIALFLLPFIWGILIFLTFSRKIIPTESFRLLCSRLFLNLILSFGGAALMTGVLLFNPERVIDCFVYQKETLPHSVYELIKQVRIIGAGIGLVCLLLAFWKKGFRFLTQDNRLVFVINNIILSGLVFLISFTIASPYSWTKLSFVKGIISVSLYLADTSGTNVW